MNPLIPKGRGAGIRPANRFGETRAQADLEHVADEPELLAELAESRTVYLPDASRSIISENDSPDLNFRYSLNPYRGCQHGCAYWYEPPKPVAPLYFPAFFEFGGKTRELTFARSTR